MAEIASGQTQRRQHGKLASQAGYRLQPLQVLQSAHGYYLGTAAEDGPISRESVEYWPTEAAAQRALDSGDWNQRESAADFEPCRP